MHHIPPDAGQVLKEILFGDLAAAANDGGATCIIFHCEFSQNRSDGNLFLQECELSFVSQGPTYDESHSKQRPRIEQRKVILEYHFAEAPLTGI